MNPLTPSSIGSFPSAPAPSASQANPLRFGNKKPEPSDQFSPQEQEAPEAYSTGERLKGAFKGAAKAIFRPRSIMMDTLIAVAITVATAWLPGSQLLTIPAYLAVSAALRAVPGGIQGYQNPRGLQPQKDSRLIMLPISS